MSGKRVASQQLGAGSITGADELIYKLQYRRKLNPVFIPLTKIGAVATAFFVYYFYTSGFGAFSAILFLGTFGYIYKNHFHYKYTEVEKIPIVAAFVRFTSVRREPTLKHEPLKYDLSIKIQQPEELTI